MADHLAALQRNQRGNDKAVAVKTCYQIGFIIAAKSCSLKSHDRGAMLGVFFDYRDHRSGIMARR
jgi:hypothetical protein